ncbi:MAG: protein-disulfide isomerase-like protein [Alphaproteobacteria bacterium]|jgi:protein-disulfide isomerase|nr:protein-disulfide isomerase-like protein [Alphaproteobacteria bacterium]
MKPVFVGIASALALAVAACGGESDLNQAAATIDLNAALPQIPAANNGDWTQTVQATPEGGYRMGNPDAPVKLVEYASISCPHCAEFSKEASEELKNTYVRSGQVSWEFRPVLLFPTDAGVSTLLRCQGPQSFFALTEQLYATQAEWSARTSAIPQADLQALQAMPPQQQAPALARAMGMDQFFRQRGMPQARIDECLNNPENLNALAETQRKVQEDGVTGTPTFFINGQRQENVGYWNHPQTPGMSLENRLRAAIGS